MNKKKKLRLDLITYKSHKTLSAMAENLVEPIDFTDLELDIENEFDSINLALISDEAKRKIIDIVREDYKQQAMETRSVLATIRESSKWWPTFVELNNGEL